MITDLSVYRLYKSVGVEWLGDIPTHWEIRRLKSSVQNVVEETTDNRDVVPVIALAGVESWTGSIRHIDSASSFDSSLKGFRAGDVLFGKLRPYLAKVTRLRTSGLCVGEFLVLRACGTSITEPYVEYLLRSKPIIEIINSSTFGAKMPRADWQFIGKIPIPLPPICEQAAIARFLDDTNGRIRRYIRAKEKLVALLEEYQQALVNAAVTGRIDVHTGKPYPSYNDSGVEWLGEVPAHWEARRLKTLLQSVDERSAVGGETLLSLRRDHGVVVYSEHFSRPSSSDSLVGYKLVAPRQIVVNRFQASRGLIFRSELSGIVSPDYSVFAPKKEAQTQFLSHLLRTSQYSSHFRRNCAGVGAGFLRVYDNVFLCTPVAMPSIDEQIAIALFLNRMTEKLQKGIAQAQKEIELLREYRDRLIADVVTGKLDVRTVAMRLPETSSATSDESLDHGSLASDRFSSGRNNDGLGYDDSEERVDYQHGNSE